MHRLVLSLAALFVLAPLARAQDAWKWDASKKRAPTVGYKSTEEGEIVDKQSSKVTMNKQVVNEEKKDQTTTFKITKETKAVEKDEATEELIKVEKWSLVTAEGEKDTSLEGQTILVKGTKGKKSYTLPDDKEHKVSAAAKRFIEEYFAKKKKPKAEDEDEDDDKKAKDDSKKADEDDDDAMPKGLRPDHPVGDGEEWDGDPAKIAESMLGSADIIDVKQSSVKGKLTGVKVEGGVHRGHVEVKVALKLKSLPTGGAMQIPWTKGGIFEITCTVDGSLEPAVREDASLCFDGGLAGSAKAETPQGNMHIKMDIKNKITMKTAPAGEATPAK